MNCRQRTLLSIGFILCFATATHAQSPYRAEMFGSVGFSEYLALFGPPVRGLNLGGGMGFRPFSLDRSPLLRMIGLELEINRTRSVARSGPRTQTYFTGNVLLHALLGRVEPYFLLGGGMSRAEETHRAGDVGVGAKIFVNPQVSVRPELRAFFTEYLGNFARVSVAIGYHW
jgi:hypothetical protein